jgi:hypothetical protein
MAVAILAKDLESLISRFTVAPEAAGATIEEPAVLPDR